jgi:quinol monooxygenase YgiN
MRYGYSEVIRTLPGERDALVEILVDVAGKLGSAGCELYAVSVPDDEPETVLVNEIWLSKEHHDRCLDLPEVRDAISAGMPLVAELRSQESTVVGGLGVAE